MTIHVSIGEAEARLTELVAAAMRGEDIVLDEAGEPQVQLMPVDRHAAMLRAERAARRRSALGMWKGLLTDEQATISPSMTDEEVEERWNRKFGPAA